jgi:NADH dehydrogenase
MFFIAGGTGFIGARLIRSLTGGNHAVRCLVRTTGKAAACEKNGFGAVVGDITDRESLKDALGDCDVVVHLVGIMEEKGALTFEQVHVRGTENLVDEAKRAGVKHFFYQSALGASLAAKARYSKTKAEAEIVVKESGIPYTIFRPSLVVGAGDGFTQRMKELIALGPVVTFPGDGKARVQPLYVDDWVKCFMKVFGGPAGGLSPEARYVSRICEMGGPEHLTYNEVIALIMEAMGSNKPVVHLPVNAIKLTLPFAGVAQGIGRLLGRKIPPVTAEQLALLQLDNICDKDSVKRDFDFTPMKFRDALRLFIQFTLPRAQGTSNNPPL